MMSKAVAGSVHLGVDLGGTKIEIIALDAAGQTLLRRRVPTPQGRYGDILQTIMDMVQSAEMELGATGTVGLGIPGSPSPSTGLIRNANSTCLNGKPLQRDLEQLLQRPLVLANDALCFTLSEASDGAASDAGSVFGVIIGTGTGAGIVVDGDIVDGAHGIAGEWGHNPLPRPTLAEVPGPVCWCGLEGCLETWLSGPGFSADHQRSFGEALSAPEIVQRAEDGDEQCRRSLASYEHRLARGLSHIINVIDPEVIVLGGGMSNIGSLYQRVPLLWQQWIFADSVSTRLVAPEYGDSSGVRGAAWLGSHGKKSRNTSPRIGR